MADITGICARVGGGKTLWATQRIAQILEKSERLIVTDIPLVFDHPQGRLWTWAEYCHEFIKRPIRIEERIAVVDFDMSKQFWRCLPMNAYPDDYVASQLQAGKIELKKNVWKYGDSDLIWLPHKPNEIFKEVGDFDFRTGDIRGMKGVDYFIDEAHKKFPPMYYQNYGAAMDWYCSELRRLDDNFSWISQHPEKVDKNLRRLTTDWWQVQNMTLTPLTMGVTLNRRFRWHWYSQNDMLGRSDKPTASG